jgi:hypothetical protein
MTPEAQLEEAEREACYQWALKLRKRGRKPEGTIDDAGQWWPSAREDYANRKKRSARSYQAWAHVYRLCERAQKGLDVPLDIQLSFAVDYPIIHERVYVEAVNARLRAESKSHKTTQRKLAAAEKAAAAKTPQARIEKRMQQLEGLEKKLKKVKAHEKLLLTKMSRVRRSIAMLNRSAQR